MYTLVVERKYDFKDRFFGLCESCYWTATILRKVECYKCPVCNSQKIALIPLSQNEKYEYDWNSEKGLQIRFSVLDKPRQILAVILRRIQEIKIHITL